MKGIKWPILAKCMIGIGLVLFIVWIVRCHCVSIKSLTPANIRDYVLSYGRFAVIFYIVAYVLNTISVFPPIAPLSLAAGLIFGKFQGALYLLTAAMLGTSATFFIARFFGRGIVERILKGRFKEFDDKLSQRGFVAILFFRLVPVIPYEVLNYIGGISKIRFRDYFFATFLGLLPGIIIAVFFGDTLGDIRSLEDFLSARFFFALGLILLLFAVPILYHIIKKRKSFKK